MTEVLATVQTWEILICILPVQLIISTLKLRVFSYEA